MILVDIKACDNADYDKRSVPLTENDNSQSSELGDVHGKVPIAYHIVVKGQFTTKIYSGEDAKHIFLSKLMNLKSKYSFKCLAVCIMDNHSHLVLRGEKDIISKVMQNLNKGFTAYYNAHNSNEGSILQGKYYKLAIFTDKDLMNIIGYVHLNPVHANVCSSPDKYNWSSYNCITHANAQSMLLWNQMLDENWYNVIDRDYVLDVFNSSSRRVALNNFIVSHLKNHSTTPPSIANIVELDPSEKLIHANKILLRHMLRFNKFKFSSTDCKTKALFIQQIPIAFKREIIREVYLETHFKTKDLSIYFNTSKETIRRAIIDIRSIE
jgi:REP element-mobilizing transposase RayT